MHGCDCVSVCDCVNTVCITSYIPPRIVMWRVVSLTVLPDMVVCDQLTHLEQFLLVDFHKNKVFKNLYEVVQYVNNIVPRL